MTKQWPAEMMVKDAELVLKLSGRQVRRLYDDGILAGRKIGRVLWLRTSSVLKYEKTRRPAGRPVGSISPEPADDPERRRYERDYQRRRRERLRREAEGREKGKG